MKFTTHQLVKIVAYTLLLLNLTSCASTSSNTEASTRPSCVTLDSYSYVIEQVMNVQPIWEPLQEITDGSQYQWTIADESGEHSLTTRLTSDGCVCATASSSRFNMGSGKEEIVGLLEGAAVAPISDLDYTAKWLEPKVSFSCGIAHLSQRPYEAETLMEDGTTWKLACSRLSSSEEYDSLYTLTIITSSCADVSE